MVANARIRLVTIAAAGLTLIAAPAARGGASPAPARTAARSISFEENGGQADSRIRFLARGRGHTLLFARDEVVFGQGSGRDSNAPSLRMRFLGGRPEAEVTGVDALAGRTYYSPAGSRGRLTGHSTFRRVRYAGVYPGIDVVYYGNEDQLEFDLEIAPDADPSMVSLSLGGASDLAIAPIGDLTFRVGQEPVTLRRPTVYQEVEGGRAEVRAAYVLAGPNRVAFSLGAYDRSKRLVVDPVFVFNTAGEDVIRGVEVNAAGEIFVLGETTDSSAFVWDHVETGSQPTQCYLAKMDPTGAAPLYTILFGRTTTCTTLALSPNGVAYFPGYESPLTPGLQATTLLSVDDRSGSPLIGRVQVNNYNPFRSQVAAIAADLHENVYLLGTCRVVASGQPPLDLLGFNDAPDAGSRHLVCRTGSAYELPLLTKVAPDGTVSYATFLASDDIQDVRGRGLAVDDQERVFVVRPASANVPVTSDSFRQICSDPQCGYVMVIDTTTTSAVSLVYASYLWPMDATESQVARLGPSASSLYVGSVGGLGESFPATSFNPYGDYLRQTDPNTGEPVTEGLQLARFDFDAPGAPRVLRYARSVNFGPPSDSREHIVDVRISSSGAAVVGALADIPAPGGAGRRFDGSFLTYYPSGVLVLQGAPALSMFPSTFGFDPTYAMSLTPTGQPVTASEWPSLPATPWNILLEVGADSLDPGANTPPTFVATPQVTVETYDPTGAIVPGYVAAFDWDDSLGQVVGIAANCTHYYNITKFPLGMTHVVCTPTDDQGTTITRSYDVTVNPVLNTATANVPISLVDVTGPANNVHTPGNVTVTFLGAVDPNGPGLTWLRTRTDQKPIRPPAGLQLGSSPFYYDVGTTAVTTGSIQLCIDFTGMSLAVPSGVRLYHLAGLSSWADTNAAIDAVHRQACAVAADANELGTFALFTPADERTRVEILAGIGIGPGNYPSGFVPPGDGGPATSAALYSPNAVAFDLPRQAMYIADGFQVRRVDLQTGIITRYAGMDPSTRSPGDAFRNPVEGGLATETDFLQIDDVALDRDGNLFLAEGQSCVIQRIDRATGIVLNVAGAWRGDQPGSCGNAGDGGEARSARISLAYRIAFDADGNLLFNQSSGLPQQVTTGTPGFIRRIAAGADHLIKGRPEETISTIAGTGQLTPVPGAPLGSGMVPYGLALGRSGELYLASYDKILRIVPAAPGAPLVGGPGEVLEVVAGGDPLSYLPFGGDQGHPLDADLLLVNDLEVLPGGELLLVHANTKRVRLITPGADGAVDASPDERITTIAGFEDLQLPLGPLDLSGYPAAGDYALSTLFFLPGSATLDPRGGIVVTGENYVRRFGYAPSSLTVSPAALDFGRQALGTSSTPRTVTVTNGTPNPLAITSVAITGDFTADASSCSALAAGASCTIGVSFAPAAVGPRTGELQVTDSTLTVHRVALTGIGKGTPAVSLDPSSLTFANQLVGTTSPPQTVTLTNTGNDDLTITAIAIAGPDFELTTACPTVLGPGLSCTIDVMSRPVGDAGLHTGELRVASDAPGTPPVVTLTGYGDTRLLSVSPSVVDFGLVNVGSTTPASTVTLTNAGTTPLTLGAIQVVGSTTADTIDAFAGNGVNDPSWREGYPARGEKIGTPVAIAVDGRGNVFFAAAPVPLRIGRVDGSTRVITTVWSYGDTAHVADGGGPLGPPVALTTDRAGNIYVAEGSYSMGGRVRRVDAITGAITVVAGNGLRGNAGNGGPALAASMIPTAIAVDGTGNLFLADAYAGNPDAHTIRRVDADTGIITLVAGGGIDAFFPNGSPATSASFHGLRAMTVDAAGNLFLQEATSSPRGLISKVDVASGTIARYGSASPVADSFALAVDTMGRLFVSQTVDVIRIDGPGQPPIRVAGGASNGPDHGDGGLALLARLDSADGLAVDPAGNLYIADGTAHRIRRVEAVTSVGTATYPAASDCGASLAVAASCRVTVSFVSTLAGPQRAEIRIPHDGSGAPTLVPLVGVGAQSRALVSPENVTFDDTPVGTSAERFVVVGNAGSATLAFGGFQLNGPPFFGLSHDCPPNLAPGAICRARVTFTPNVTGEFTANLQVTYGGQGNLSQVRLTGTGIPYLNLSTSSLDFQSVVVGTGAAQSMSVSGRSPLAISGLRITGPQSGDYEVIGCPPPAFTGPWFCNVLVTFRPTDVGSRSAQLEITGSAGGPPFTVALRGTGLSSLSRVSVSPLDLDFGTVAAGAVPHRTTQIVNMGATPVSISQLSVIGHTTTAGALRTLAGDGGTGSVPDGVPAINAHLGDVYDVAVDPAGNQYLADPSSHRVWRIDSLTGRISSVAGTGTPGYGGDGGPATTAALDTPTSVAVDASGRLYIADTENHRVRRVEPHGPFNPATIVTVAGNGTPGYAGDGGPATLASLHSPQGLAIDGQGNLFIAETLNHVIRRVAADGTISTVVGDGVAGSGLGYVGPPLRLDAPVDVAVSPEGDLAVADAGNSRVVRIERPGSADQRALDYASSVGGPGPFGVPGGVAVDALGRIFFSDTTNHRVGFFDPVGNTTSPPNATAFAGNGSGGWQDSANALLGRLYVPRGLAVDAAGHLLIADSGNRRLRQVDASTSTQAEFIAAQDCVRSLAPGESCDVDVAFAPGFAGVHIASLAITHSAAAGPRSVDLHGIGTQPTAYVGTRPYFFGVEVGTAPVQAMRLVNSGNGDLHVSGVGFFGPASDFATTSNCPPTLPAGEGCTIEVTFAPTTVGSQSARLQLLHDGLPVQNLYQVNGVSIPARTQATLTSSSAANTSVFGEPVTFSVAVTSPYGTPGGTVSFKDNGSPTALLPDVTLTGGAGSEGTTLLTAGTHVLQAFYGGDGLHAASASSLLTHIVAKQPTATTLSANALSLVYGQSLLLTAAVASPTGGPITGSVLFSEGATPFEPPAKLTAGSASQPAQPSAGSHKYGARYLGDPNSEESNSNEVTVTVAKAATTTTLASDSNPAYVSFPVTFTATVTPPFGGAVGGSVTFRSGPTTVLGVAQVVGNQAVLPKTFTSAQTVSVTAIYSGDANLLTSASAAITQSVQKVPTTLTVTSSPNPSYVGQSVTFTVTVTSPKGPPPDGQQIRLYGLTPTPLVVSLIGGSASYATSSLSVGSHFALATYAGNTTFLGTLGYTTHSVLKFTPTVTLTSNPNPSSYGETVTFEAQVSSPGGTPPDGELVTFNVQGLSPRSVPLAGGIARFTTTATALTAGTHSATARYGGDATILMGTSAALSHVVTPAATTTALTSSLNPSNSGARITFTAVVTSSVTGVVPTGSVTFRRGTVVLGTVTLNATGRATYQTTPTQLPRGSLPITATYGPNPANFATSVGSLTQVVN